MGRWSLIPKSHLRGGSLDISTLNCPRLGRMYYLQRDAGDLPITRILVEQERCAAQHKTLTATVYCNDTTCPGIPGTLLCGELFGQGVIITSKHLVASCLWALMILAAFADI
jgi:hypothetical protein